MLGVQSLIRAPVAAPTPCPPLRHAPPPIAAAPTCCTCVSRPSWGCPVRCASCRPPAASPPPRLTPDPPGLLPGRSCRAQLAAGGWGRGGAWAVRGWRAGGGCKRRGSAARGGCWRPGGWGGLEQLFCSCDQRLVANTRCGTAATMAGCCQLAPAAWSRRIGVGDLEPRWRQRDSATLSAESELTVQGTPQGMQRRADPASRARPAHPAPPPPRAPALRRTVRVGGPAACCCIHHRRPTPLFCNWHAAGIASDNAAAAASFIVGHRLSTSGSAGGTGGSEKGGRQSGEGRVRAGAYTQVIGSGSHVQRQE